MTLPALLAELAASRTPPTLINPYRERFDAFDVPNAPQIRLANLAAYLAARPRPRAVLAGEAIGWRGGRFSGIAFTSERQLAVWGPPYACSSLRPGGWAESSATIIHGVLDEIDAEQQVVLWNSVPFHPHPRDRPLANRAPKAAEVALGRPYLERLLDLLQPQQVIAVGRVAETALGALATGCVRHPSRGGATQCRAGLRGLLGD